MHDTSGAGKELMGRLGWIFAFNNFIFFFAFLRSRTLPILHISPLKANIRMILHNKQIHPQQTVSGFSQTSQPRRLTKWKREMEREIVIDTFLLSIFSMNVCLLKHQSIHLIFWVCCVTLRFRLSWLLQHTKTHEWNPCKIYASPFAYSINVCATVDSLFCVISRLITHSIDEAQVS